MQCRSMRRVETRDHFHCVHVDFSPGMELFDAREIALVAMKSSTAPVPREVDDDDALIDATHRASDDTIIITAAQ